MNPILTEIRNDLSGAEALRDWLGDGGVPVHVIVAEMRANRCTIGNDGQACPLNVEPNWWDRAKSLIADWIRKELEIKNGMALTVEREETLNMCKACGCCLRLKVWAPAVHLKAHITAKQLQTTPDYCWMRKELL